MRKLTSFALVSFLLAGAAFAQDLTASTEMDANQMAHQIFANKAPKGCSFTGGQEINGDLYSPSGSEAGIYLLNAECNKKPKQFIYLVVSGETNKDVLFTGMKDAGNQQFYFQQETRRLFTSNGTKLREVEWQPLAKKAIKKTKNNAEFYTGLFGKTVPKGKLPSL